MLTLMSTPAIDWARVVSTGCDAEIVAPANEKLRVRSGCPVYGDGVSQNASSETPRVSAKAPKTIGPPSKPRYVGTGVLVLTPRSSWASNWVLFVTKLPVGSWRPPTLAWSERLG